MPDVTGSTDDGLKAEIVSKDKPADKAGMINGDIIIELNGKKLKIYTHIWISFQKLNLNQQYLPKLKEKEELRKYK